MKRFIAVVLVLLLCLGLAGCEKNENLSQDEATKLVVEHLGLIIDNTQHLYIGDSLGDARSTFGEPDESNTSFRNHDDIEYTWDDDITHWLAVTCNSKESVNEIKIRGDFRSVLTTLGISIGDSRASVREKCGDETKVHDQETLIYSFTYIEGRYELLSAEDFIVYMDDEEAKTQKGLYSVMLWFENGKISSINITKDF